MLTFAGAPPLMRQMGANKELPWRALATINDESAIPHNLLARAQHLVNIS
jgi:hypothetical protein